MNIDRFSHSLASERVDPFFLQAAIQEQNELNKRHLVSDYLESYWGQFSLVPSFEQVSEALYKVDIDEDLINSILKEF